MFDILQLHFSVVKEPLYAPSSCVENLTKFKLQRTCLELDSKFYYALCLENRW